MTRKQWEDLEEKLVHVTIKSVSLVEEFNYLNIECKLHETDSYFKFELYLEDC